ncbi:hypothetical protein [Corallincola spongiicola]|uniref:Uncharacterized protein n=1 Tax=Corallincola spongiicola TaxID=2520508 RepID=A0ABY1WUW8_9GAMM|nr:hypothetical protein [Corallincola spongiicola]TAA48560.1 hypothetical protein EXY25_04885 [Corallincola spongiicola]
MASLKAAASLVLAAMLTGCCLISAFPGGAGACARDDWQDLVEDGHYEEAFSQLDRGAIAHTNLYSNMLAYDILNVVVHRDAVTQDELLCSPVLAKYPNSFSWTMQSCKLLQSYLANGTLDQEILPVLERSFSRDDQYDWWLPVLKSLG